MKSTSVTVRPLSALGGDSVRAEYMINLFETTNKACSAFVTLFGIMFLFKYLLKHLLNPRYLFIPVTCYLAMLRLRADMINCDYILTPKLCFLSLNNKAKAIDWVDYLPISYLSASKYRGLPTHLRVYYKIEASLFKNAYHLFSKKVEGNFFVSMRDVEAFQKLVNLPAKSISHLPVAKFDVDKPSIENARVLFVANYHSKFNRMALDHLIRNFSNLIDFRFTIVLSGRGGQKLCKSLEKTHAQSFEFIEFEKLTSGVAQLGYAVMPASAGQQNKIYDYLRLGIFPLVDERSSAGLGLKLNGRSFYIDPSKMVREFIEEVFVEDTITLELNNYE